MIKNFHLVDGISFWKTMQYFSVLYLTLGVDDVLAGTGRTHAAGDAVRETGRASRETGSASRETGSASRETGSAVRETSSAVRETVRAVKETGGTCREERRGK